MLASRPPAPHRSTALLALQRDPPRRSSAPQPPPPPLALSQATQRHRRKLAPPPRLPSVDRPFRSIPIQGERGEIEPPSSPVLSPTPLTATTPLGHRPSATRRPLPPAVVARPPRAASRRAAAGDRALPPHSLFSLTPGPPSRPEPPARVAADEPSSLLCFSTQGEEEDRAKMPLPPCPLLFLFKSPSTF